MQNQPPRPPEPQISMPLPTQRPLLTYALLTVIVGIFVVQVVYNQVNYDTCPILGDPRCDPIMRFGALNYPRVLQGEWYRLFTAMFLHANQVHLLFNGLALFSFGRTVESLFGTPRFGLIYLLGGLSGSLASLVFTRGLSVGASGAIFAIFGAEMVFLYVNRELLGRAAQEQFRSLIFLALINFGLGVFTAIAGNGAVAIDNWAHLGGFVGGLILTWFIGTRYQLHDDPRGAYGLRVVDENAFAKTWPAAAIYAVVLLGMTIFAVTSLGA